MLPSKTRTRVGVKALADHINITFKNAVKQDRCRSNDHCIFWIDSQRGGRNVVGGIFWGDYSRIVPSERAWDIPQVFGHTPSEEPDIRHARGLKLINVDAGMCERYGGQRVYLEVTVAGEVVQHSKDGSRWSRKTL